VSDQAVFTLMIVGFAVCFGLLFLAIVLGGVLIVFFGIRLGAHRQSQVQKMLEEWAQDNGYELLKVGGESAKASPVGRRLMARGPGLVQSVEVRDRNGRVRQGWMFIKAQKVGAHYSGFRPETFEVVFEA
jgi:hypothetical protein